MSDQLEVRRTSVRGVPVGAIDGDIDFSSVTALQQELSRYVSPSDRGLVLDLTATSYVDSAGVHLLAQLSQTLAAHRQQLRLVLPSGHPVRHAMSIAGIDDMMPVHDDLEGAVAAVEIGR